MYHKQRLVSETKQDSQRQPNTLLKKWQCVQFLILLELNRLQNKEESRIWNSFSEERGLIVLPFSLLLQGKAEEPVTSKIPA